MPMEGSIRIDPLIHLLGISITMEALITILAICQVTKVVWVLTLQTPLIRTLFQRDHPTEALPRSKLLARDALG